MALLLVLNFICKLLLLLLWIIYVMNSMQFREIERKKWGKSENLIFSSHTIMIKAGHEMWKIEIASATILKCLNSLLKCTVYIMQEIKFQFIQLCDAMQHTKVEVVGVKKKYIRYDYGNSIQSTSECHLYRTKNIERKIWVKFSILWLFIKFYNL
jgi:hypothetical protein